MALAATQMALDDAQLRPGRPRPVPDERDHRQRLGRQRVRPEGDPEPLGQGPDLRRRLPVDRVVLRGDDGPDRDQVRDEGRVRRRPAGGRGRARGARALAARDPARRRHRRQRAALEAPIGPYALACQLHERPAAARPTIPADAYRPFDKRANGYVPGEGGAIVLVESLETRAGARRAAAVRRDRRLRRHQRRLPLRRAAPDGRQFARAMSLALERRGHRPGRRRRRLRRRRRACPRTTRSRSRRSRRSSASGRRRCR